MTEGSIIVYYGNGHGKSAAALGLGIKASAVGKSTIMISFMKGRADEEVVQYCQALKPEIKFINFEKSTECYMDLTPDERALAKSDMMNGLAYARKVLMTGECQMLILDEILGLIDMGVIETDELIHILEANREADVVITGRQLPDKVKQIASAVYSINDDK